MYIHIPIDMALFANLKALAFLTLIFSVSCNSDNKRIVFHSSEDIMQVITNLEKEVRASKNKTAVLESKITALESNATTLERNNAALGSKITALESNATTLERNNAALGSKITALESNATTLERNNAVLESKITALEANAAALENNNTASQNRIAGLELEILALKATDSSNGVTYVRWGRTTCPANGTELVYKGYMAGADYTETGGGSNNLCLPEDPSWSKYVDGYDSGAVIYGTEIELVSHVSDMLFGKQTLNQDVPCAVCRSSRASHVMIPARASCYPGWTQEYSGYVIAALPSQHKGDYVCLDTGLEFVPHGAANDNDHLIRPVEVRCGVYGSLPCPPFVDGRELACVVCTK